MTHNHSTCPCHRILKGFWGSPIIARYILNEVGYETYRDIYIRAKKGECNGCLQIVDLQCLVNFLLFLRDIGIKEIVEMDKWCWGFDGILHNIEKRRWKK